MKETKGQERKVHSSDYGFRCKTLKTVAGGMKSVDGTTDSSTHHFENITGQLTSDLVEEINCKGCLAQIVRLQFEENLTWTEMERSQVKQLQKEYFSWARNTEPSSKEADPNDRDWASKLELSKQTKEIKRYASLIVELRFGV